MGESQTVPRSQYRMSFVTEFLGTMALVIAGAGSVALTSVAGISEGLVLVALVFGATVFSLGATLGRLSSVHINPAVSLAHVLSGRLRPNLLVPRVLFQVLGAICGGIVLSLFFPSSAASGYLGSTLLASTIPPWTGTILEAAGTFVLSIVILTPMRGLGTNTNSMLVGFALFILIMILGPLTSASLNPARSIGPAIVSRHLEDLEVYIIGPLAGGLLAGVIARIRR